MSKVPFGSVTSLILQSKDWESLCLGDVTKWAYLVDGSPVSMALGMGGK